jgi:carbon-monoxide dehydrogenase large subunit
MLTAAMVPGGYKIRGYEVDITCIMTNKCAYGAYRGVGQPISNMVRERLIDIAAEKLGIDRIEIRKKNLIKKSEFPYRQVTGTILDPGSYIESLEKAAEMLDVAKWEAEQKKALAEGRYIGIGMCVMSEASTPNSFFLRRQGIQYMRGYESASVTIDPTGKVSVALGVSPQGQSHETIFAQIVADELGVGIDDVTVIHGDTSLTPYGFGTFGSRSTGTAGSAAMLAAKKVKEKTLRIAAAMLEAPEVDLEIVDAKVQVKGVPQKALTLKEVARAAYMNASFFIPGLEPGLSADHTFEGENMPFPNSTHMVALEVEAGTGEVKILKYVIVEDCGVVINPKSVEGQIHGATAHGIGGTLYEELVYDENGQLLTSTFMDYLVPTALEIPEMEVGHIVTPTPVNPLGAKAAGEAGTSACPAAIMNAVADALKPLGVKVTEMPLTPSRVWAMIDRARRAA